MKKINLKKPDRSQVIRICNLLSVPLQFLGCCVLYFIIEALSRHSILEAWVYMTESPLIFLYNADLIFTTSLLVYLFRRRILARLVIGSIWLILGIVNCVLLMNRVTPFTGPDLKLITDALGVLNKYLSPLMVVVVIVALILLIFSLIWIFRKGVKYQGKIRYWINIPLIIVGILAFSGISRLALEKRVISNYFGNIAYAYQDYGYPYCLAVTLFDTGISEPNGYSEELINEIQESEGKIKATNEDNLDVNILFLQLETFIDPTEINFLEFSEDPIPNFRELMKEYSSGYYKVPAVGAGTANTEFESITGMSLRYFGAGEYPYKTVLKEETCESAPYVLKDLGYSTHAIHNNEANFYGRKTVFARLGFDTFTSEEYMPDISDTTPMGWVKDHILTDEIVKAMESTEGPDYVYTISVQGHGDYPEEPVLSDPVIQVSGSESQEKDYAWEYYVNQLYEMDRFVKELTDTLAEFDERVILVMYGDHLPTMDLKVEDMKNRYLFQTKYVIWDNFGMEKKDENLAAYQMAAEIFDRLGIHEGNIFNYHQTRKGTKNYQLDLETLQYDVLYGDRYVYGGETPYAATKLQLGVNPAIFTSIEPVGENSYFVYGENFTASSHLEVNGELKETKFLSTTQLLVQDLELEDGDELDVATQSNSPTKKVLSRTGVQIYHAPEAEVTPEPASTPGAEESKVGESANDETDSKASGETNNSTDDDTDLPVEK
ncbi:MAG: LTA synthase family protein [Oliverpabstia sp.]|nr:LTA synthase family protein [Lachnospiraceae bacterium]MDY5025588.1 LTA synthase family protein [Oliverpabstia sp.]